MYRAPIDDLRFVLEQLLDTGQLARLPRYKEFSIELAAAVLTEADNFASGVLAPLNQQGDRVGASWTQEGVTAAPGFGAAYQQYVAAGWPQLGIEAELGGQGAPYALVSAVEEIWYGANMALMLCPMLTRGAIETVSNPIDSDLRWRIPMAVIECIPNVSEGRRAEVVDRMAEAIAGDEWEHAVQSAFAGWRHGSRAA